MKLLTDELYDVVDSLYLRRDGLSRIIQTLQREQADIYSNMDMHDTYTLYTDIESELESIIEEIEELEYRIGELEMMELDFKEYSNMDIEELKNKADDYGLSTKGNELELTRRLIAKIHN